MPRGETVGQTKKMNQVQGLKCVVEEFFHRYKLLALEIIDNNILLFSKDTNPNFVIIHILMLQLTSKIQLAAIHMDNVLILIIPVNFFI